MLFSEFINDFQEKLSALNSTNISNNIELIKSNLERLQQIEAQLQINAYKLVFIGEPGSGKTTTICNYLNLTKDLQQGDRFSGYELFDTASGRTTAFEVRYAQAEQTKFLIHPMEISKQIELVREYCDYNWRKVFNTIEEENKNNGRDGCSESDRIIRNMLGYQNDTSVQQFIADEYSDNTFDAFLKDMLFKIALDDRTCTEIIYNNETDIRKWLKKEFNDINFGKRPDTAIPELVEVFLCPDDIDFMLPSFISEVIDTRGYDGGAREDLRSYICSYGTISVILDKVESLPDERQRKILSEWIGPDENDIIDRVSLMIKDKDDALSKVNEADDDSEKGEQIKREELSRAVSDNKLNYNEANTIFVDSYFGISFKEEYKIIDGRKKKDGKSITDLDTEIREFERNRITKHLEEMINRHKSSLTEEAERICQDTEQLYKAVMSASVNDGFKDKLRETEQKITAVKDVITNELDETFMDFEPPFCSKFRREKHWASARKTATVAWHGTWQKADFYAEYIDECERLFRKNSFSKKEQIIGYINEIQECDTSSAEINSFVASCLTRIELEYRRLIEKIRDAAKEQSEQAMSEAFWETASNVDRGSGYYDRLMDVIRKQMRRSCLCQYTENEIQYAVDYFFNEIMIALHNESNIR